MTRYVLTGTTGKLGSRILRSILERGEIAPVDLVISSSDPTRVPAIAREHGVEIRQGDYMDTPSLQSAFAGADVLFLMSHPDPGVQRVGFHKNAIETARAVGVKTVKAARGGHFAAWEQPKIFVEDLRKAFASKRT